MKNHEGRECKRSEYITMAEKVYQDDSNHPSTKGDHLGYLPLVAPITSEDLEYSKQESLGEKFWARTKENPLVPLGLAVTIGALVYGSYQIKTGNKLMSQYMMRLRVGAQFFTVAALLGGVQYHSWKKERGY